MDAKIADQKLVESGIESEQRSRRVEIDTSAPFESVKEAATRFGGMGFWKPALIKPSEDDEVFDIIKVGEQAAQLEQDLIAKEKETCNVLQELESTKNVVEELKLKLQKEASEINSVVHQNIVGDLSPSCPSSAPGFILLELKQAKLNLARTTSDLAEIRASVDVYNKKIEKERLSLEKTRQRLISNTSKISSLEHEVNQTKRSVKLVKDNEIANELQKLSSEIEQFRKIGEGAKWEVSRAMSEIEMTKSKIRTAEIHLYAAKKMKEAARATEAVALAQVKGISKSEGENSENVTLTLEEYSLLVTKARAADEASNIRVLNAMGQVDEANVSKLEILKKVEEATEEVKITKTALEEALCRVEAANQGKLAVEEAMRKWRSEKKRSVHNSTKFKNSHSVLQLKEIDLNFVENELKPVLKPTLSIGQILSRKLLLAEDYEYGIHVENTKHDDISLSQMLSKPNVDSSCVTKSGKENNEPPAKRKKFGFGKISRFVTKQNKKKKKQLGGGSMCRNI